jgi:hypothetical protein
MRSIIVLCAALACASAAAGEVYKWKDKDGRVHYGDKPKTGQGEAIMVTPDSGSGEPSAAFAEGAARDAECAQKKARLQSYRAAPSISEIDNLGKTREYTAAERKQYLDQEQARVDAACAPKPPSPEAAGTFPPPEVKQEPIAPRPEEEAPASPPPG